jgi:hypothetical protein
MNKAIDPPFGVSGCARAFMGFLPLLLIRVEKDSRSFRSQNVLKALACDDTAVVRGC